ncbi:MAG: hypothetical protein HY720_10910 [Planctomycetes bacterium]|nr:hypothetical protein [Planctomycetota bacterium]
MMDQPTCQTDAASGNPFREMAFACVPALVLAIAFLALAGHRKDYLGHYAAGFGATLAALLVTDWTAFAGERPRGRPLVLVALCLACVGGGAFLEATIFRLAVFDEVDFFNQSLGAALAGLAVLRLPGGQRPGTRLAGLSAAGLFVIAGVWFAFAR